MQHWFCKYATFRSPILNTFALDYTNLFVGSVLVKKIIFSLPLAMIKRAKQKLICFRKKTQIIFVLRVLSFLLKTQLLNNKIVNIRFTTY